MKKAIVFLAALSTFPFLGFAQQAYDAQEDTSFTGRTVKLMNFVAADFYKQNDNTGKNFCYSSFEGFKNLSMLYTATKKGSEQNFAKAFGIKYDVNTYKNLYGEYNNDIEKVLKESGIYASKSMFWVHDYFGLNSFYARNFSPKFGNVILRNSEYIVGRKLKTDSLQISVNEVINNFEYPENFESVLSDSNSVMLAGINAFNGKFKYAFGEKYDAPFYLGSLFNKTEDVTYVCHTDSFRCAQSTHMDVVEIPYSSDDISLIVIRPNTVEFTKYMADEINVDNILFWISSATNRKVQVALPQVSMSSCNMLTNRLRELVPILFVQSGADLTRLVRTRSFITDIVVFSQFSMGESAKTASVISHGKDNVPAIADQVPVLAFNRPFAFVLFDKKNGAILNIGKVYNPLQTRDSK